MAVAPWFGIALSLADGFEVERYLAFAGNGGNGLAVSCTVRIVNPSAGGSRRRSLPNRCFAVHEPPPAMSEEGKSFFLASSIIAPAASALVKASAVSMAGAGLCSACHQCFGL